MTDTINDNTVPASVNASIESASDEAKTLLTRAQEAIGSAIETTVEAVKENPVAAAAIAGGVAAAAAGAVYGVSRLRATDAAGHHSSSEQSPGQKSSGQKSSGKSAPKAR